MVSIAASGPFVKERIPTSRRSSRVSGIALAQFVKAVRVKRGYELDIEFNVSFEEFQALYLEPEEKGRKRKRAGEILALAECAG